MEPFRVEIDIMTAHGIKTFTAQFEDVVEADACYRATAASLSIKNMVEHIRHVQEVRTIVMQRTFPDGPRKS